LAILIGVAVAATIGLELYFLSSRLQAMELRMSRLQEENDKLRQSIEQSVKTVADDMKTLHEADKTQLEKIDQVQKLYDTAQSRSSAAEAARDQKLKQFYTRLEELDNTLSVHKKATYDFTKSLKEDVDAANKKVDRVILDTQAHDTNLKKLQKEIKAEYETVQSALSQQRSQLTRAMAEQSKVEPENTVNGGKKAGPQGKDPDARANDQTQASRRSAAAVGTGVASKLKAAASELVSQVDVKKAVIQASASQPAQDDDVMETATRAFDEDGAEGANADQDQTASSGKTVGGTGQQNVAAQGTTDTATDSGELGSEEDTTAQNTATDSQGTTLQGTTSAQGAAGTTAAAAGSTVVAGSTVAGGTAGSTGVTGSAQATSSQGAGSSTLQAGSLSKAGQGSTTTTQGLAGTGAAGVSASKGFGQTIIGAAGASGSTTGSTGAVTTGLTNGGAAGSGTEATTVGAQAVAGTGVSTAGSTTAAATRAKGHAQNVASARADDLLIQHDHSSSTATDVKGAFGRTGNDDMSMHGAGGTAGVAGGVQGAGGFGANAAAGNVGSSTILVSSTQQAGTAPQQQYGNGAQQQFGNGAQQQFGNGAQQQFGGQQQQQGFVTRPHTTEDDVHSLNIGGQVAKA